MGKRAIFQMLGYSAPGIVRIAVYDNFDWRRVGKLSLFVSAMLLLHFATGLDHSGNAGLLRLEVHFNTQ